MKYEPRTPPPSSTGDAMTPTTRKAATTPLLVDSTRTATPHTIATALIQATTTTESAPSKTATPSVYHSKYPNPDDDVAKIRYEPLEPLKEPPGYPWGAPVEPAGAGAGQQTWRQPATMAQKMQGMQAAARPVDPQSRQAGSASLPWNKLAEFTDDQDLPSFTDFDSFFQRETSEEIFLKSFAGSSFVTSDEFSPKVQTNQRVWEPDLVPTSSMPAKMPESSKSPEPKYRYSTTVEVSPKPQVPKFLPHNQIIKATFFEDQENSLEEPEVLDTTLSSKPVMLVKRIYDKKPWPGKKRPGLIRVPEKFQFFPLQHKTQPKFPSRPMNRNPKSLFKDLTVSRNKMVDIQKESGHVQDEDEIIWNDNIKNIENTAVDTQNETEVVQAKTKDDSREADSKRKATAAAPREALYQFHGSVERKLLQKEDDTDVDRHVGYMQRHQPTDSQIEKPDPIAMESQEEDSTIPKENSTVQEEDSTVQKEELTVQEDPTVQEDRTVQEEDSTVQKEDSTVQGEDSIVQKEDLTPGEVSAQTGQKSRISDKPAAQSAVRQVPVPRCQDGQLQAAAAIQSRQISAVPGQVPGVADATPMLHCPKGNRFSLI